MPDTGTFDSTAIAVRNLTKRYGIVTAVDKISFAIGTGEFFGSLGPNGAGKTTTVRIFPWLSGTFWSHTWDKHLL